MKLAIVGSGISGLVTAYLLNSDHDITLFEAEDRIGGHTCTLDIEAGGRSFPVDTGFIVFNEATYPNFIRLMRRLGVDWQPSAMSFSVKCPQTGLEFRPSSLNTLFIQRRNLLAPAFYRMIWDIVRFRRDMRRLLESSDFTLTLNEFLERRGYSQFFKRYFLIPMGAAIWSSDPAGFQRFPARFFAQFFHNHGFLDIRQPRWLTLKGGSRQYLDPITRGFRERIRTHCPVTSIRRLSDRVEVLAGGVREGFDAVVVAAHSDQALALLADPSGEEREILGAIAYQANRTVLHTDSSILPRRKAAWAAWNYLVPEGDGGGGVALTYDMNILQSIPAPVEFCVSLNLEERLDPAKVIRRMLYHHPVYSVESLAARRRLNRINGVNRTYYAGAYWGYGFHEDGVNSALEVCRHFGKKL
ncbi:MAG: FAD-dependent oxidoreductase [Desulfobacterales bacterium]|jgi:predicted NAD/FAD-binding protein|nr:FAD-dependent oxidoreductase [Desulfobacterales bacterium]